MKRYERASCLGLFVSALVLGMACLWPVRVSAEASVLGGPGLAAFTPPHSLASGLALNRKHGAPRHAGLLSVPRSRALTTMESARLKELEDMNRRIAFPIVLTTVSGAAFVGIWAAYFALLGCGQSDCQMEVGGAAMSFIPAIFAGVGSYLLYRRVPLRREYRALLNKSRFGSTWNGVGSRALTLSIGF
jgi:hypothetical protein